MARILIVYGTSDGHTGVIAERIATSLRSVGQDTTVFQGGHIPPATDIASFDAFIVGASVHYGKFQTSIRKFITAHKTTLSQKPSAFFAVSGASSAGAQGRQDAHTFSEPFLESLQWQPTTTEHVAGAFPFTRYSWWKKLLLRFILKRAGVQVATNKDYVFTDWDRVHAFAIAFAGEVSRRA